MTLAALAAAAAAVFLLAATAQAVTGFGFALVAVPLLVLVTDSITAVVATTAVGLVLTGLIGYRERGHVQRPTAVRFIVAGLIGMPLGLVALARLDERSLTILIAVAVLLAAGLLWSGVRVPAGPGPQWGAGLLSGALLTSTGMNGPPVVLMMQARALPPRPFRATLQVVFFGQDVAAVAAFAVLGYLDPAVATVVAAAAVGVPAGWWLGDRLFGLLPPAGFRILVLTTVTASAAVSLATAAI
ncbi:sulfite exporter TauE/SafE family protein [Geodermatophilus sp. DF01-2]|uniref:sulfite exporter TauE/SafE family protein n=1 Tax=Geodermatophilus sp. DF01-2 TaxID=2559610 RepID=UPI00143095BA|nr:sulfite exporter TauE/SafE family protein [Geodermatophilus sp. DF01_2]